METMNKKVTNLDYEEGYHTKRHSNHSKEQYYLARAEVAIKKFFKNVDINKKILDYGCGLGQNMLNLPNAVGYDISEYGVNFCREKGLKATNHLDDLEDNSFDYVFSSHVLEHHPHPKTMLEEMYSKLKPGGELLLVIPFERHGKGSFELDLNQHLYMWNFQIINNLLNTIGFKIVENKYVRGAGYHKLLSFRSLSPNLYFFATNLLARITGIKEIMVTAKKPA